MWPEINTVIKEKRHELVLSGDVLDDNLKKTDGKIDEEVYNLMNLNYLSFSNSILSSVSENISNLSALTTVVLQGNELTCLPNGIGKLSKLKLLNVSENHLEELPQSIANLSSLVTLNASHNEICTIPSLKKCNNLSYLDLSHNKLEKLDELCDPNLSSLTQINVSHNSILTTPPSVHCLPSLKILDLSNNKIKTMPSELGLCTKLKELNLKNNSLADHKLRRLVENDRTQTKQVAEFFRKNNKKGKNSAKNVERQPDPNDVQDESENEDCNIISVLPCPNRLSITAESRVKNVRKYLVCAILKNIDLGDEAKIKKFLSIQTKLHDGLCEKRVAATIGTHDLKKIVGPLLYTSKLPSDISVQPLNHSKETRGPSYLKILLAEAEKIRKQTKRNNVSGIHRYLHIVKDWTEWPCLSDANGKVLSLPPLTNCEISRIDKETTEVFVEVTSSTNLQKAKDVMNTLIENTVLAGLKKDEEKNFVVEQVKVIAEDGTLKVMYPSRNDLQFEHDEIKVIRSS